MDDIKVQNEAYEVFVEKFKHKKTTDDCYTPQYIYDVILEWAIEKCRIPSDANIVRPFYPGGDYENYPYMPNDVVVDNPPFSIVTKIRRFYMAKRIPFFLFAPHITLFSSFRSEDSITFIVANGDIVYENGAFVATDFITNMWPTDDAVVVAGDLHKLIDRAINKNKVYSEIPRYNYPPEVVSSAILGKFASRGLEMSFPRREVSRISKLDAQIPQKKAIFGGGLLISERLAAERLAAERLAAERLAAERLAAERLAAERLAAKKTFIWALSDREREIIRSLSDN